MNSLIKSKVLPVDLNTSLHVIRTSAQIKKTVLKKEEVVDYYLIIPKEPTLTVEIDVAIGDESSYTLNILTWCNDEQSPRLRIKTRSTGHYGTITIRSDNVLNGANTAEVIVESTVVAGTSQNKVDQAIQGFLLHPNARMNGQPVLIMESEDVMAKHSLKLGSVDSEEMFYLMSRQIDANDARLLLIWSTILEHFEPVQTTLMHEIGGQDENFSQKLQAKLSLIQE